jgi:hypothetical protein
LELRGTIQNASLPLNSSTISSYVLGAPPGVTYSNITTPGTYNLSSSSSSNFNILVNLPPGYVAGTYTGSLTVTKVVNLTMDSNIGSSRLPIIVSDYVTGEPDGTIFNPSQINDLGTFSFSDITVTLPEGYVTGTYSGNVTVTVSPPIIQDLTTITRIDGNAGTSKYPGITGYNALYITSGTGNVNFYKGHTIKNIFLVGGGAGGADGSSNVRCAMGGSVSSNNISVSGNNIFYITIGSGGARNAAGSNTTCSLNGTTYTASGGDVTYQTTSIQGTTYTNNLYYGGYGGGVGSSASLGGGGGGGGNGSIITTIDSSGSAGGSGGGITSDLSGGLGGSGSTGDGKPGANSTYGGGGGGGGSYRSPLSRSGGSGGDGLSDTSTGGSGNSTSDGGGGRGGGGGGGDGGKNTGGGGGQGGLGGSNANGKGGTGGSGIVIILYQ